MDHELDNFRLLSKNVNTMNSEADWIQWKAMGTGLEEESVSVFAMQEPNVNWDDDTTQRAMTNTRKTRYVHKRRDHF